MALFEFGPEVGMGYGANVGQTAQVQEANAVGTQEQQQMAQAKKAEHQAWVMKLRQMFGVSPEVAEQMIERAGGLEAIMERFGNGADESAYKDGAEQMKSIRQQAEEMQRQMQGIQGY